MKTLNHMSSLENSRHLLLHVMCALAVLATASAAAAEFIPVDKQAFKSTTFPDKPGLEVIVSRPMELKLGGAAGLMGYRWRLETGTYEDVRQSIIDGREVVILPVTDMLFGEKASYGNPAGAGSVGACFKPDGHYIGIDVKSGNVLQRGFVRNKSTCNGVSSRMDWLYTFSKFIDEGDVKFVWGNDYIDAKARAAELEQASAAGAESLASDLTRSAKSKIGARICRRTSGTIYVGYTEAVSPDNGKIQIRIADALVGGHTGMRPGGFQPSIVWDSPDLWELCE